MKFEMTSVDVPLPASPVRRGACSPWVLPEDGFADLIAVEIAASGTRRVALTPTERVMAAARILAAGGTAHDIAERLHLSGDRAYRLARQATATRPPSGRLAA